MSVTFSKYNAFILLPCGEFNAWQILYNLLYYMQLKYEADYLQGLLQNKDIQLAQTLIPASAI